MILLYYSNTFKSNIKEIQTFMIPILFYIPDECVLRGLIQLYECNTKGALE